ncbi:MAG: ABC transporter ATP-binding protein [Verrucomicrobiae bacterium]|nr:ABC transporter ATP-binding protein [Verrucomicrobiae bacterium]
MPETENMIEVRNLVREFNGRRVLDGVNFVVPRGQIAVIMGGSGCGKSTLLRHIIGALKPTSGEIWLMGKNIASAREAELQEIRLKYGMLFQSAALFNSMTVGENVALPLIEHGSLDPHVIDIVVKLKLEMVGLTGFEHLKPSEISGGMKKRVGLARAIALDPRLLFCDEPTAGLDPIMTAVVDELTMDLCKKLGMTAVVVTHDMASAFRIADLMIMLHKGKVVSTGSPAQIQKEMREGTNPILKQFVNGEADGPIPFRQSSELYLKTILGE